ncbi:unconventional myosin-IXb-like isoform X5 [Polyodon spathula]|uniref:unconventional myosin-IXb-like isoform X5 n=1 Tax=Polyodon spathula TaxID=7913 RepID=UPI001B7D9BC1|nr:unconventional myosin-IXb-like isoform X5 [Polyodon spathula]
MSVKEAGGTASQDGKAYPLQIYPRLASESSPCCTLTVPKSATAAAVIQDVAVQLELDPSKCYVLAEVKECGGEEWVLEASDLPVQRVLLWPRRAHQEHPQSEGYYFLLQERNADGSIRYVHLPVVCQEKEARRLTARGFLPPRQADFDDLCNLPQLTEAAILDNLKNRFHKHIIYTYAGSILLAINPFKFLPIYNPKYVKMYDNHQLGKLEPHIFAIADVAYHAMLRKQVNQCIVISGESGSGKTQSTNFLIHCLTALSQKGYASGVERTILGAGPVLEAFGNAKTAYNNNSSRFGKFIQVNYLESGVVRGAVVEKYLLEKSRLLSREKNERNYHVFYYLLLGASEEERKEFKLLQPDDYIYLKQQNFKIEDGEDLRHDFERLQQAMEMVGFLPSTKKQIFSVLSAILYLGNVWYQKKSSGRDEGLEVGPPEVLNTLSELLKVQEEMLVEALTKRKTVTVNEKLILPYSLNEAITARDSMAKSLYSALFDWIVLRINHALLNKKDMEESVTCLSIGVLDIFGFEDFETNSFEQFCINYANEQLQYYFNQHIFKLEQEEYQSEGISWHNIEYTDNVGCIHLISKKPTGLFHLLDEESNFPHATNKTLLAKFKQQHDGNQFFVGTPVMEPAFIIRHFAGKVKYQIKDFREKNTDYMRPDIVALLRSSDRAYIRELVGMDPVAVFRWAILRAAIRGIAAFCEAGRRWAAKTAGVVRRGCRVPLGELQRANKPVEKVYRRFSLLDFSFDNLDECSLDAFEDIFISYSNKKKNKSTKQKQLIPKNLLDSKSLKHIVSRTLHDRTTKALLHLHKKKKPPSISAQFQTSLSKLMETLGRAEPFFIRCIRSNSEKMELRFDDALVLQQLRYTGMLETVRIRHSGYSAKYTFQEFVGQFRVLLPKNSCTSQEEVSALFEKMGFNKNNYQIGKTKVFMKEAERQRLQDTLHKEVIRKIVFLQRWFRAQLERRHYQRMRQAAATIQKCWRSYIRHKHSAATTIQALWRGYSQKLAYQKQLDGIRKLQAVVRGHATRRRYRAMSVEKQLAEEEEAARKKAEEAAAAVQRQQAREEEGEKGPEVVKTYPRTEVNDTGKESGSTELEEAKGEPSKEGEKQETSKPEPRKGDAPVYLRTPSAESIDKLPRGQDKRERRRQRGLEHDKLQNKLVSTPGQGDHPAPTTAPSPAKGEKLDTGIKLKERSDSKELDQYTFVEWKMKDSPGKKEGKCPPDVARPSSLPLSSTNSSGGGEGKEAQRNGQKEPSSPTGGTLHRYSNQTALRNKGEKWKEKIRTEGCQQESLLPEKPKLSQTKGISTSLEDLPKLSLLGLDNSTSGTYRKKVSPAKSFTDSVKQPNLKRRVNESPGHQETVAAPQPQPQPPTPDSKPGFFRKILKKHDKRSNKDLQMPEEPEITFSQAVAEYMQLNKVSEEPLQHPGDPSPKARKNPDIKISNAPQCSEQWHTSLQREITSTNELKELDEFLRNQVNDLRSRGKQLSDTENIFIMATMQFRENIKTMYSRQNQATNIRYRNLMKNYQVKVASLAGEKQKAEVQLVVNLFQSVLDGFIRAEIKKEEAEPAKPTKTRKRRKKDKCSEKRMGHVLSSYQVNIIQSCDQCTSYIFTMEKALICSYCKIICHKKCIGKIQNECTSYCAVKNEMEAGSRNFGVRVCALTSDRNPVPVVLEVLLEHVEMNGLYTEGIYRKSGSANRMKELWQRLEADPTAVNLEEYPIHAVTGIVKQWLRELPDPLMTFTYYNDFLHAVEMPGKQEQLQAIYRILDQLPQANYNTLERLVFHLVRVAREEPHNRMTPNALAIVYAPCVLRCPDNADPLTSMKDVVKTTMCVEMLINEQIRKYNEKIEEIEQLEYAEALAVNQLKLNRQNTLWPLELRFSPYKGAVVNEKSAVDPNPVHEDSPTDSDNEAEKTLMERIKSIKEEKEEIVYRLPELEQPGSDQENLDSEASLSTESLLDERTGNLDAEGPAKHLGKQKSHPIAKPPRSFLHDARVRLVQLNSSLPLHTVQSPSVTLHSAKVPRRAPTIPTSNIKLSPSILPLTSSQTLPVRSAVVLRLAKGREQPARRKDSIQSVYVVPGQDPCPAQPSPDDCHPSGRVSRRFSDPDIPYTD